jgi:hypothetical protein
VNVSLPSVRLAGLFREGRIANTLPMGIRNVPPATAT